MISRRNIFILLGALHLLHGTARSQWTQVDTGIEYSDYTLSTPNNVFVTRMDRGNLNVFIDSSIGQGKLASGRETVTGQFSRYNDAINYWNETWGNRNKVVVAVNGDFFDLNTGIPTSGQVQGGWYCKRYAELTGGSGFAWRLTRDAFIGSCVKHITSKQTVTYPGAGVTQELRGINFTRNGNQLWLYTPQFDATTGTDNSGSEVLVELDRPGLIVPSPSYVRGFVRGVLPNQGNTPIPFDHVVLSATSTAATTMLANATPGAEVRISQEISDYQTACTGTPSGFDWTKTYGSVGTNFTFLKNGVEQTTTNAGLVARNPRTAVAFDNSYIYFIVVDGRSGISVGMSMAELADFCANYLPTVTWGANLDGGGSSCMVVNGVIKNVPSDGTERTVANGLMMCVLQPKSQSTLFDTDDIVKTTATADVRLGPGTNYAALATVNANTQGTILGHNLAGVYAKGSNWWKCSFTAATGWTSETALALVSPAQVPGDFNGDIDVDQEDFGRFQACYTGHTIPQNDPACAKAKLDADSDVDEDDVQIFLGCMTLPNGVGDPNCASAP